MGEDALEEILNVTSTKFFLRPEPADLAKALEIGRRDGDQAQRERGDLDLSSSSPMIRAYPRGIRLSDYARFKSVMVKPPLRWPVLGQAWTEQPITLEIWLQWYEGAEQVEMFWGPEGSELAFFRFENVQNLVMPPSPEMFAVLDHVVGEWLGTDSFDIRQNAYR